MIDHSKEVVGCFIKTIMSGQLEYADYIVCGGDLNRLAVYTAGTRLSV